MQKLSLAAIVAIVTLLAAPPCQAGTALEPTQPLATSGWTVTSSADTDEANLIDSDLRTFWAGKTVQVGGQWIQIDFGRSTTVGEVRLLTGHGDGFDWGDNRYWARGLHLEASEDGQSWRTVLRQKDTVPKPGSHLFLPLAKPAQTRYLKITQTNKADGKWFWWRVNELQVYDRRVSPPEPTAEPIITIDAGRGVKPIRRTLFGVAIHSAKLLASSECLQTGKVALMPWVVAPTRNLGLQATLARVDQPGPITAFEGDPDAHQKKMAMSIEVFARFCEESGIPLGNIMVGLESISTSVVGDEPRSPEFHAKWVEYVNCPADENWNGGEAWAKLRVQYYPGRVEPYGFRYFQGANEPFAGHPGNVYRKEGDSQEQVARKYSDNCRAIWRKIHETDPTGLSLFGPQCAFLPRPKTEAIWGKSFVDSLEGEFDFLVPHCYQQLCHFHQTEGTYMQLSFNPSEYIPRVLARAAAALPERNKLGRRPFLWMDEWGVQGKKINDKHQWDWMSTHANALMRVMTMIQFQKQCEQLRLEAAANWNLFETSGFGLMPRYNPPSFKWPTYLAYEYFNKGIGETELPVTVANSEVGLNEPLIQVLPSLSADGKTLYVIAVNANYEKAKDATFVIQGATPDETQPVKHTILNGDPLKFVVSMEERKQLEPTTTVRRQELPAARRMTIRLEEHSMNVLAIPLK